MKLKGLRTMIVAAVAVFGGFATAAGYGIPAETLADLSDSVETLFGATVAVAGIVMAIFRMITTTAPGEK